VVELIEELSPALGFTPALRLDGLIDTRISKRIAENVLPVLREALTNTARHAHAHRAEVGIRVDQDSVTLTVSDDGTGLPATGRRSGLSNLEIRASELGGTFSARSAPRGGTELTWQVPLSDD
jgi:signal transduction histidine kinase